MQARPWPLAFLLAPAVSGHLAFLCPFLALTGLPCPGCGLSRSVAGAAHLDFAASFALHPFGAPLAAACVVAGARMAWAVARAITAART